MEQVRNISNGERTHLTSLLGMVNIILKIESDTKTTASSTLLVIPSGTQISHHQNGEADSTTFAGLAAECRAKAQQLLAESHDRLLLGKTNLQAEGFSFPNGLTMVMAGFSPTQNRAAVLWVGNRMGWMARDEVSTTVLQEPDTAAQTTKLFQLFTALADQAQAA